MKPLVIALSIFLAIVRPIIIFHPLGHHLQHSYEACCHLLVGGLYGSWYNGASDFWQIWTALALTGWEIVCVLMSVAIHFHYA